MPEFKREIRYIVIKRKDFHTERDEKTLLAWLDQFRVSTRESVVVESDWPIYDDVWEMVQRMDEGRPQKVDELKAMLQDAQWAMTQAEEKLEDALDNWHETLAENVRLRDFIKKWDQIDGLPGELVSEYNQVIK